MAADSVLMDRHEGSVLAELENRIWKTSEMILILMNCFIEDADLLLVSLHSHSYYFSLFALQRTLSFLNNFFLIGAKVSLHFVIERIRKKNLHVHLLL